MRYIIDNKADCKIFLALKNLGAEEIIKTSDIPDIGGSLAGHPDLQIHFVDDNAAVCAPQVYNYYKKLLSSKIIIIKGEKEPCGTYPNDIAYNVARIGKNIICNVKYTEPEIIDIYQNLNYTIIDAAQGYSKCSLCIVDDNSVITEDAGLYSILSNSGIEVCKITPGYVHLKDFPYGFIGGASGRFENKILLSGNINNHPDKNKIFNFVKARNLEILELTDNPLQDYGSIIGFS